MRQFKGVEAFIKHYGLSGAAADQVREWGEAAMYWNAFILLDPEDVVTEVMGAQNIRTLEDGLKKRIDRKLDLLPAASTSVRQK